MNYSSFGKELKKIMIDNNSRIYDLAKSLDVSSAFVSSVICGNRSVPESWIPIIVEKYDLNATQEKTLVDKMMESKKAMVIDLTCLNSVQKNFTYQLQRNLGNLSNNDIEELEKIIGGDR